MLVDKTNLIAFPLLGTTFSQQLHAMEMCPPVHILINCIKCQGEIDRALGSQLRCSDIDGCTRMLDWIARNDMDAFESQYFDKRPLLGLLIKTLSAVLLFSDQLTNLSPLRNCMPPDVLLRESRQPA
ncbi:hypothetical protein Tco_1556127 [Tanacetum coccineum]